jgi:DNA-binding Lrp family transcriptional regulator
VDADAVFADGDLDEERLTHRSRATAERNAHEENERVHAVAEKARRPGYDSAVTVRHLEPTTPRVENKECAACGLPFLIGEGHWRDPDRHNLLVHSKGGCERARERAAARGVEPATADPPAEHTSVAQWRDESVAEWMRDEGPKTTPEIREHFGLSNSTAVDVVKRLRARGLIERTGTERAAQGRGGRPAFGFRAVEPREAEPAGANPSGAEGAQPKSESPTVGEPEPPLVLTAEQASAEVRRQDGTGDEQETETHVGNAREIYVENQPPHGEPTENATAYEWLTARYVAALIASIERASVLRAESPPVHVFDRIERILGIAEDHPTNEGNGRVAPTP